MHLSDFDYHLPPERIAQTPVEPRHASRLLVLNRASAGLEHSTFWDIGDYLRPGDLLVINQTRVIPARMFARKPTGGRVELLLLRREDETHLGSPGGRQSACRPGMRLQNGRRPAGSKSCRCWKARAAWCASMSRSSRTWSRPGRCRCRPTSTRRWPTPSATRPSTPPSRARPPRPPPGCTSPRS